MRSFSCCLSESFGRSVWPCIWVVSFLCRSLRFGVGSKVRTLIVFPCSPGKDLEQCEVCSVLLRFSQLLDVWRVYELGEDEGVWCGGSLRDEIARCSWRGCGLAEGEEGLERVERFGLLHCGCNSDWNFACELSETRCMEGCSSKPKLWWGVNCSQQAAVCQALHYR